MSHTASLPLAGKPDAAPSAIRVITLWQPWAQWVMLGWKTIETRTHARFKSLVWQRIGIHAGLKWDPTAINQARRFLTAEQVEETDRLRVDLSASGKILGTVFVEKESWLSRGAEPWALIECESVRRHGLFLVEPRQFMRPVPAKGAQGIWKFAMPNSEDPK